MAADKNNRATESLLDDSHYWTKQRRELVQWMADRAPSFTEGYISAVHLLHMSGFPARVHLVSHLIRDIYRFLPATLEFKPRSVPSEVFPELHRSLSTAWNNHPLAEPNDIRNPNVDVPVHPQVYACIKKLVQKVAELSDQQTIGKQLAIALYRAHDRRDDEFIHPWIIDAFEEEYKFFVSRAHLATDIRKVPDDEGLVEHFVAFERAFHGLVGPYFSGKEEMDAILQDTNQRAD